MLLFDDAGYISHKDFDVTLPDIDENELNEVGCIFNVLSNIYVLRSELLSVLTICHLDHIHLSLFQSRVKYMVETCV